jgi:ribosomal protein L20
MQNSNNQAGRVAPEKICVTASRFSLLQKDDKTVMRRSQKVYVRFVSSRKLRRRSVCRIWTLRIDAAVAKHMIPKTNSTQSFK